MGGLGMLPAVTGYGKIKKIPLTHCHAERAITKILAALTTGSSGHRQGPAFSSQIPRFVLKEVHAHDSVGNAPDSGGLVGGL
jgi:hypothetical protein